MKVWQPGSHLTMQRGATVEDWSWRRTVRRVSTLARLAAPYKGRTGLAVASLLVATLTALAPPYLAGWTGERILADLRNALFRHLQRLSLGFYERNRAGVIISRLNNDVDALDQLVTDGVTSLVQSTLFLFGTAIILFFLDWRLALATLSVMPLMAIATALFRMRSSRAYR